MSAKLAIRRAKKSDAPRIAELSGQLGYQATATQILKRLRTIKPPSHNAVFVAEVPGGGVIGWLHVSVVPLLEMDTRAEINALVVADEARSRGTGAALLREAEAWSGKRGCKFMSVRSNVLRRRAHEFYVRNGYDHYKTQKAFRKTLA